MTMLYNDKSVISSRRGRTFPKFPTLNACKKKKKKKLDVMDCPFFTLLFLVEGLTTCPEN